MTTGNKILNVLMNGALVGKLEKSFKGGLSFTYENSWVNVPSARPISLSLPLISRTFVGDIVYDFFDNLLPDNSKIRARIQAKFRIASNHPFDLLASIGRDCVGAIQIISDEDIEFNQQIECKPINAKKMVAILQDYQGCPLGMSDDVSDFRISIAGAQLKAAFLYYNNQWNIPLHATPTTHIFKLPIGVIQHQNLDLSDSCENEWLCLQIAAAFGLPTAKSEILHFDGAKVLSVERFDRVLASDKTWIMRLPQEDMCQALGITSNLKYQSDGGPGIKEIMQLLLGSINPEADQDLFYRAQILFWLLAAIDGHAKNFSIFIKPEGKYRLTPLYDIMSAYPLISDQQLHAKKIKMAMALKGKNVHYNWYDAKRRYFIESAKIMHYSTNRAEVILTDMLEQVSTVIEQVERILPSTFPNRIAQPIFSGMRMMRDKLV